MVTLDLFFFSNRCKPGKAPVVVDYWYTTPPSHALAETYVRWILVMLGQTDRCYKLAQCKCSFVFFPRLINCWSYYHAWSSLFLCYYTVPNKQVDIYIYVIQYWSTQPATTQWTTKLERRATFNFSGVTNCLARPCAWPNSGHMCLCRPRRPATTYVLEVEDTITSTPDADQSCTLMQHGAWF